MSVKQATILRELNSTETITLDRAVELVGGDIYANKNKHVGQILSRMVKNGSITRIKKGFFQLNSFDGLDSGSCENCGKPELLSCGVCVDCFDLTDKAITK